MTPDPRLNAPARLSDLHGDARSQALYARHQAASDAFMQRYRTPPAPGLLDRLKRVMSR